MDWSIFTTTFLTIFIAEIGDKTQFAALAAASQTKSVSSVLLATILALSLAGGIGVLAGSLLGKVIDPEKMRAVSGVAFILMGCWILFKK
ncbi:MAG: TMEM165/GDT1 family protein [Bdellovibrionota bacterium]|jgi:putative Ca2+/H+ antiporter (TMEM165/GDT1 family)|nr:TMEM165/GDT1 family protein [Bdellovibrionota bacterium]